MRLYSGHGSCHATGMMFCMLSRWHDEWLTALDPYQHAADAQRYVEGLHKAGFA
jgi:hypothetical protein